MEEKLRQYENTLKHLREECQLIQNEVNIMSKLLFMEQRVSDHLINCVFVLYDKGLRSLQQNYHLLDEFNELEAQKAIAKQNEYQLKQLRKEMICWRNKYNRIPKEVCESDHSYSLGTDWMSDNKVERLPTLTVVDLKKYGYSGNWVKGSKTTSVTVKEELLTPKREPFDYWGFPVKLQLKEEPIDFEDMNLANAAEDTDTASEWEDTLNQSSEPLPSSSNSSEPFVREYLPEIQTEKEVFINLSEDTDYEDQTIDPIEAIVSSSVENEEIIFDNTFDDLPSDDNNQKKCCPKKATFIKRKKKCLKTKRVLNSCPKQTSSVKSVPIRPICTYADLPVTFMPSIPSTSSQRVFYWNQDCIISTVETTETHNKKLKTNSVDQKLNRIEDICVRSQSDCRLKQKHCL